jgi:hypothetical protein
MFASALTKNPDKMVTGSGFRAVSCGLATFVLVVLRFDLAMAGLRDAHRRVLHRSTNTLMAFVYSLPAIVRSSNEHHDGHRASS